jgi:SAM-dependent methyltransferase
VNKTATQQRLHRTVEQRHEHYQIERAFAQQLRLASKDERKVLYSTLYNELFRRVPHHPQLQRKSGDVDQTRLDQQLRSLMRFLKPDTTFMEIGAGDCGLAFAVAPLVAKVWAIDVSEEISRRSAPPANFRLIISDGTSIDVPAESVDLAYSNQLMEHLHPDDAADQLRNIYAALRPGGAYLCLTPSRLSGPHDVSRFFDREATCFHLKEYTSGELAAIMREAGFRRVYATITIGRHALPLPILPIKLVESLLSALPYGLRRGIARRLPVRKLLGRVIAIK